MSPPSCVGMGTTTGTLLRGPRRSWNRDSRPQKVRPRLASGASRCTTASNACFPAAAAGARPTPTVPGRTIRRRRPCTPGHPRRREQQGTPRGTPCRTPAMAAPASPPAPRSPRRSRRSAEAGGAPGGAGRRPSPESDRSQPRRSPSPCRVIRSSPRSANANPDRTQRTHHRARGDDRALRELGGLLGLRVSSATVVAGTRSAARFHFPRTRRRTPSPRSTDQQRQQSG